MRVAPRQAQVALVIDIMGDQFSTVTVDAPFVVRSIAVQTGDTVRVKDGRSLTLTSGAVQNLGTIAVDGEEDVTALVLLATASLGGPGKLILEGTGFAQVRAELTTVPFVNDVQHTVRGIGTIIALDHGFLNAGVIAADVGVKSYGELAIAVGANEIVVNAGTMDVTQGPLRIANGSFVNVGLLKIGAGRAMTCEGQWTQFGGTTRIDGTAIPQSQLVIAGGTISGSGNVAGALICDSATVEPGNQGGFGTLTVEGLSTSSATIVHVELSPESHDTIHVLGDAFFDGGTIDVTLVGPEPASNIDYLIVKVNGALLGELPTVLSCIPATLIATSEGLVIRFSSFGVLAGDINHDGIVTAADLSLLIGYWGECNDACCAADIDGNGTVDSLDLATLLAGWGIAANE